MKILILLFYINYFAENSTLNIIPFKWMIITSMYFRNKNEYSADFELFHYIEGVKSIYNDAIKICKKMMNKISIYDFSKLFNQSSQMEFNFD